MNANAKELVPTKKNEMPYLGSKKSWSIALFCLLDARCHVEETKQSLSQCINNIMSMHSHNTRQEKVHRELGFEHLNFIIIH